MTSHGAQWAGLISDKEIWRTTEKSVLNGLMGQSKASSSFNACLKKQGVCRPRNPNRESFSPSCGHGDSILRWWVSGEGNPFPKMKATFKGGHFTSMGKIFSAFLLVNQAYEIWLVLVFVSSNYCLLLYTLFEFEVKRYPNFQEKYFIENSGWMNGKHDHSHFFLYDCQIIVVLWCLNCFQSNNLKKQKNLWELLGYLFKYFFSKIWSKNFWIIRFKLTKTTFWSPFKRIFQFLCLINFEFWQLSIQNLSIQFGTKGWINIQALVEVLLYVS